MATQTGAAAIGHMIIAAMQAGDLDGVLALIHPDIEVHEPESLPYGGTWRGRDGFTDLITTIMGIAEMGITAHTAHETADGVILAMDVSFTSRNTGDVLRTRVVEVDRVEDGMLRDVDVFYKDVKATVEFFERT